MAEQNMCRMTQLRLRYGISQADLANAAGVSRQLISLIELDTASQSKGHEALIRRAFSAVIASRRISFIVSRSAVGSVFPLVAVSAARRIRLIPTVRLKTNSAVSVFSIGITAPEQIAESAPLRISVIHPTVGSETKTASAAAPIFAEIRANAAFI